MESRRKRSRSQLLKWGCYVLALFVCAALQTTPGLFQLGEAKPLLVLPLCLAVAVFEGEFAGALLGTVGGLLWDYAAGRTVLDLCCCTGGFGLGSDFLYLLHEGAGGVVIGTAPGVQLVVNAAWDAVAADDHLVARRDISGGVCYQCAPALEVFHGLGVVDEGAEGGHLAALIQQTVGQLDRAVHAEAETRSLCKSDFHCLSFLF